MGKWSREELESAFEQYQQTAMTAGTTGDWNASHYKNPEFDSVAKTYLAAAELAAQRKATKRMAGLRLPDTPVITDYFINYVTASTSKVKNYVPDGISQVRLSKVSLA